MQLLLAGTAVFLNGLLAGASLDQSVKQLPARHKIGSLAYTNYSQATDLGNGVVFYAILGIGAALATISAATITYLSPTTELRSWALYLAATFSLLHSFTTTQAAPINFSQLKVSADKAALTRIFDRFERWQTVRSAFVVSAFITSLLAIIN